MLAKSKEKKINSHCRDRVHYAVSDTTPKQGHLNKGIFASYVCRWSIAAGKRPVPFRTRKLSLHTLMVLQPGGCGRVSHRRHQTTTNNKIQKQQGRRRSTTVSFSFYVLRQPPLRDGTSPHTSSGFRPHGTAHTCRERGRQRTLNPSFYPRFLVGCDSGNPCGFRAPYSNTNTPTKATCPLPGIL